MPPALYCSFILTSADLGSGYNIAGPPMFMHCRSVSSVMGVFSQVFILFSSNRPFSSMNSPLLYSIYLVKRICSVSSFLLPFYTCLSCFCYTEFLSLLISHWVNNYLFACIAFYFSFFGIIFRSVKELHF